MTARQALDQIEQSAEAWVTVDMHTDVHRLVAALRAVLDLHQDIDGDGTCASCANWDESERVIVSTGRASDLAPEVMIPCPTVRAITEALGGGA